MPAGRVSVAVFAACLPVLLAACGHMASAPATAEPPPLPPASTPAEPPAPPRGCGQPAGEGTGESCPYERAVYAEDVNQAIARVVNEHPEYFDLGRQESRWSFFVEKPDLYLRAVVKNLEEMGFCARFDGAEIALKRTNELSEQYDVYTSKGFSRWGGGAYAATCRPAWF